MDCSIGWLLDVSVGQIGATIWIKTKEGNILKLIDNYQPNFYVLPKNDKTGADLFKMLSQQSMVKKVEWEYKFTDLFDDDSHGLKNLICVYPESIQDYNTLLRSLEKDARVVQLYNTDISHVQQYLFTKLEIEPTSKVEVQYDKNELRLIKLTKVDEHDELAVAPPPFSILYFEIHITSSSYNLGSHDASEPITEIRARYQQESEISFEGSEHSILKDFSKYVLAKDPDILFSTDQHSRRTILDYLFMRIRWK